MVTLKEVVDWWVSLLFSLGCPISIAMIFANLSGMVTGDLGQVCLTSGFILLGTSILVITYVSKKYYLRQRQEGEGKK